MCLFGQIQTSRTGGQLYSYTDTSPYEVLNGWLFNWKNGVRLGRRMCDYQGTYGRKTV